MSVTLVQVVSAARARVAPLVSETAGYLALEVADQVALAPRAVAGEDVVLEPDGSVRVLGGAAASGEQATASIRQLLATMLGVARSITPAMLRASQPCPGRAPAQLVCELEAGLIPVNRAAGRRALSRLFRETLRAVESGMSVDVGSGLVLTGPPSVPAGQQLPPEREPPVPSNPVSVQSDEESTDMDAQVLPDPEETDPTGRSSAGVAVQEAGVAVAVPCADERDDVPERPEIWVEIPVEMGEDEETRPEPAVARSWAAAGLSPSAEPQATPPSVTDEAMFAAFPAPHEPIGRCADPFTMTPPLGSVGVAGDCGALLTPVVETVLDELTDPLAGWGGEPVREDRVTSSTVPTVRGAVDCAFDASPLARPMEPAPGWVVTEAEASDDRATASEAKDFLACVAVAEDESSHQPDVLPDGVALTSGIGLHPAHRADSAPSETETPVQTPTQSPVLTIATEPPEGVSHEGEPATAACDDTDAADEQSGTSESCRGPIRPAPATFPPRRSTVSDLLATFSVADEPSHGELCRGLKQIAGLDTTPLPAGCDAKD